MLGLSALIVASLVDVCALRECGGYGHTCRSVNNGERISFVETMAMPAQRKTGSDVTLPNREAEGSSSWAELSVGIARGRQIDAQRYLRIAIGLMRTTISTFYRDLDMLLPVVTGFDK